MLQQTNGSTEGLLKMQLQASHRKGYTHTTFQLQCFLHSLNQKIFYADFVSYYYHTTFIVLDIKQLELWSYPWKQPPEYLNYSRAINHNELIIKQP